MITLPDPLRRWATELDLFPPELALALGQQVRRLDALVGPLRPRTAVASGSPDGFSGLSRRGPYERLLTSEWLLADELPDEFLRRAAMNEHAFFELALRTPASRDASFALFDAGPAQLGAPRLVQLALLIVLFRRASEAKVPFAWGVLQRPDVPLTHEVTATSLQVLLEARTTQAVGAAALQAWRDRFSRTDDVWFVGAPAEHAVTASRVDLEEEIEHDSSGIRVHVRPQKGDARATTLEPPSEADGTRLLRDPFAQKVVVESRPMKLPKISPASRLIFGQNGRSLMMKLVDGRYAAIPVPNSPNAQPGKPRIIALPDGRELVGMTVRGKFPVYATVFNGVLSLSGSDANFACEVSNSRFIFHAGLPTPAAIYASGRKGTTWWMFDSVGKLLTIDASDPVNPQLTASERPTYLAASAGNDSLWMVGHTPDRQYKAIRLQPPGPDMTFELGGAVNVAPRAFLGCGTSGKPEAPWIAIRTKAATWCVGWGARCDEVIEVGESDHVLGVLAIDGRPGLLVLRGDQRRLVVQTTVGATLIAEEAGRILVAATDAIQPQLAYRTGRGELVIYRYDKGFRRVLRIASGEAAP